MNASHLARFFDVSRRHGIRAVIAGCAFVLIGCGNGYEGDTYADSEDAVTIEFKSDKEAYVSLGEVGTTTCEYEVDGDKVILKNEGGNLVLTRKSDGTLDGGLMFGTLRKKA